MRRRAFIAGVVGAAALPFAARAQQTMPVVSLINGTSAEKYEPQVAAFRVGLKETGFVDGQNITIEYRWAKGDYSRLSALAADLVKRQVAVIVANTPANIAAKKATDTIPVVFTTASDPGADRSCHQSQSSGWQCHWHHPAQRRAQSVSSSHMSFCR